VLVERTITTSISTTPPPSTLYTTTTVTSTTTTTLSSQNACPTIPATDLQSNYTTDYILYHSTCGRVLSYANPANTNPPVVLPIRSKVLACQAAAQCAAAARNQGAGYLSFDLHWRFAAGWECVMFFGRMPRGNGGGGRYWEVEEGVGEGYGYSL